MKKFIYPLLIPFILLISIQVASAQCTPLGEEDCPDPEGNGEICPDTITPVIIGIDYHQEVTMIAPPSIDTMGFNLDLDHITLVSVDGLPDGINWVTNAENDEFFTEIYYCILFSGTTQDSPGEYPLTIVVDIYAEVFGEVIKLIQLADSTSLSMQVIEDATFIGNHEEEKLVSNIWPNPFNEVLQIELAEDVQGRFELEVFNLMGEQVIKQEYTTGMSNQVVRINGDLLQEGIYFVSINYKNKRYSRLVSKIR